MSLKDTLTYVGKTVVAEQTTLGAPSYTSPAEGYGHMVMALSDAFREVKDDGRSPAAREAALAVAVAAIRYAQEVCRDAG